MRACAKAAQINANVINGVLAIWPRTVRETAGRRCWPPRLRTAAWLIIPPSMHSESTWRG